MRRASFDLAQASAAVAAGGVLSAILRAEKKGLFISNWKRVKRAWPNW
jgi:hypothetical protein